MRTIGLVLCLFVVSACGPKLPPSYSQQAQRASNAHQLLQETQALSVTAINLNALPGGSTGRLSDADTRIVRDFALAVADAVPGYVASGTPNAIGAAVGSLTQRLSSEAAVSPQIKAALAVIRATVAAITGGV